MKDYRKFLVWQKSHRLVLDVYEAVKVFPKEEMYGLPSQMKRAAASVPMNIAEGCGRKSEKDLSRFLVIAFGSASELEYQFILSKDLQFLNTLKCQQLCEQIEEVKK